MKVYPVRIYVDGKYWATDKVTAHHEEDALKSELRSLDRVFNPGTMVAVQTECARREFLQT